jgi:calnexin
MLRLAFLLALSGSLPLKPKTTPFHFESFATDDWETHWQISTLENYTGRWYLGDTPPPRNYRSEKMMFAQTENAYYALATKFDTPLVLKNKPLVLQYETRFVKGVDCGGAYIKLFGNPDFDPPTLSNESRYVIMFGPDKCGETDKVHFIFNHKNPLNGTVSEKHLETPPTVKTDKINHLYTLIVRPNQTFEILIDAVLEKRGNLFDDFEPPVNPPIEIDDPTDSKPPDWEEEEMIEDPDARKPDDWDESQPEYIPDPSKLEPPDDWFVDEPRFISDPNAKKPEDWDDEILGPWEAPTVANPKCQKAAGCGDWEPPLIQNPHFQGKWTPPQMPNPAYRGEWVPRQIANPDYYEDKDPYGGFPDIVGAGFELWMVNNDIGFGNVYIGQDEAAVKDWNEAHFKAKFRRQDDEFKKFEAQSKAKQTDPDKSPVPESLLHREEGPWSDFMLNVKDAWALFYEENPELVTILAVSCVAVPIVLVSFCTCFKRSEVKPKPRKKLTPEQREEKRKRLAAKREAARLAREAETGAEGLTRRAPAEEKE